MNRRHFSTATTVTLIRLKAINSIQTSKGRIDKRVVQAVLPPQ
jgi:hypothetical protein